MDTTLKITGNRLYAVKGSASKKSESSTLHGKRKESAMLNDQARAAAGPNKAACHSTPQHESQKEYASSCHDRESELSRKHAILHASTADRVQLESVSSKQDDRPISNASKYFSAQFKMTPQRSAVKNNSTVEVGASHSKGFDLRDLGGTGPHALHQSTAYKM